MKTKRLFAAILAVAMALSLFACAEKPAETTTKTPEETTEKVTETTVETTLQATEETTEETFAEPTEVITTATPSVETTEEATTVAETTEVESTEVETTDEATTETETSDVEYPETETVAETRFDYLHEDLSQYITFESGALDSITVEISDEYAIDENDVQAYINDMLFEYKTVVNNGIQTTTDAIRKGDSAFIYYRGYIDGEEFDGGSNWTESTPYELEIGRGYFIAGFEEQLIGVAAKDTAKDAPIEINVTFPENYWEESFAGANATFEVWVVYVVQYDLPEYNVDFIINELEYETEEGCTDVIEEFEAGILAELEEMLGDSAKYAIEDAIQLYLLENSTVLQYPQDEAERYFAEMIAYFEMYKEYYEMFGMTFESLDEFMIFILGLEEGADWETILNEEYTYPTVHLTLAIFSVAQEYGITVTDEEYWEFINDYADNFMMTPEEVIADFGDTQAIYETIISTKVMEFLMERNTVSYE